MTTKPPVKSYDSEFKQRAVKLAVESESQAQVARDLGISKNTLYRWIRQYHGGSSTPGTQVNEEHLYEELKRRRQENKRLTEERDLLTNGLPRARGLVWTETPVKVRLAAAQDSGRSPLGDVDSVKKRGPRGARGLLALLEQSQRTAPGSSTWR